MRKKKCKSVIIHALINTNAKICNGKLELDCNSRCTYSAEVDVQTNGIVRTAYTPYRVCTTTSTLIDEHTNFALNAILLLCSFIRCRRRNRRQIENEEINITGMRVQEDVCCG